MTDIRSRLEVLAAAPYTHRVTTHYASGATKTHDTRGAAQAENWAIGERRKVGHDLLDRATGSTVRVASVTISTIQ
ncbi:hypothetical protein LPB73_07310 [Tardiphaga sp. 37S4]|uniref:hypothetical protein n=1 Tax=Tardiphaga sp. 37S4 TaxID=1404741 RepID=UPI001E4BE69B|nr:hypothetical protein [Tardiphaga sp. 37S4]UFS77176.1 hypothetical protein LPB73_07310 [Tardiphaga sp. 37S4]